MREIEDRAGRDLPGDLQRLVGREIRRGAQSHRLGVSEGRELLAADHLKAAAAQARQIAGGQPGSRNLGLPGDVGLGPRHGKSIQRAGSRTSGRPAPTAPAPVVVVIIAVVIVIVVVVVVPSAAATTTSAAAARSATSSIIIVVAFTAATVVIVVASTAAATVIVIIVGEGGREGQVGSELPWRQPDTEPEHQAHDEDCCSVHRHSGCLLAVRSVNGSARCTIPSALVE
jgi:hypothetical protein